MTLNPKILALATLYFLAALLLLLAFHLWLSGSSANDQIVIKQGVNRPAGLVVATETTEEWRR
jgi:hypothetical protein